MDHCYIICKTIIGIVKQYQMTHRDRFYFNLVCVCVCCLAYDRGCIDECIMKPFVIWHIHFDVEYTSQNQITACDHIVCEVATTIRKIETEQFCVTGFIRSTCRALFV